MKRYIKANCSVSGDTNVIRVELSDGAKGDSVSHPNTFKMTAETADSIVWVGMDDEGSGNYVLANDIDGDIYSNASLYEVLSKFTELYDVSFDDTKKIFSFARKYFDSQNVNAASDTQSSDKYVIVRIGNKYNKPEDQGKPMLFIDSRFDRDYKGNKRYYPNFTTTRANNISRAKLFNSKEEAEAFIQKQGDEKNLWNFVEVSVMPYSEAIAAIGDSDANYKDYKKNQETKRREYNQRYSELAKQRNAKNKEKDPGKYKVRFWYANSWLGCETFTVDAESVDDAFKKAKAKALQQDPNRASSGYDERMIFNKNEIKKIS